MIGCHGNYKVAKTLTLYLPIEAMHPARVILIPVLLITEKTSFA